MQENSVQNEAQLPVEDGQVQEAAAPTPQQVADEAAEANASHNTEKLEAEVNDLKDKYLRLYSDFENFRKRTAREKQELVLTAGEEVIKTLLPVVDDFQRALKFSNETEEGKVAAEGYQLIYTKLWKALEQKGLRPMEIIGEPFDAEFQEAITQIPAGDENKGKVVDVIETGYFLYEKPIRFAKVVIGA